jgi:LPXTG-motif cell wall-anchored protein
MRLARVAACTATAALLTTATGTGSAAAAEKQEVLYRATSSTGVVQLELTLPVALPGVPNPAVITLLGTDAQALHDTVKSDIATATSFLAGGGLITDGTLASLLAPLNRTVTSSLQSPGLKTATALEVPANPLGLDLSVGAQKAAVDAVTRLTTSQGGLASARLGSLRSLGLGDELDTALTALTSAVATLVAQASAVTTALNGLPALPSVSVPNPLSGVIPGSPATISTPTNLSGATLAATVAALPAQVEAILDKLLDGAVVSLGAAGTDQRIVPAATSLLSSGGTDALDLSLFGGLVDVSATKAVVSATAGLTKQAAKADASATLLDVKVSTGLTDLVSLVASDKGITAGLLDGTLLGTALDATLQPVVQQADAALNTVLSQLTALLTSLNSGAQLIEQGTATKKVSADGRSAEAHAVPARVTLGLPVAPDLLTISVGMADAVSALSVATPTVVTPTAPELPHTGASSAASLMALALLALAGGTFLVRRRQHG